MKKKKKKKTLWIIILIIVLLIAFGFSRMIGTFRQSFQGDIQTYTVERGDISYTAVGSGRISSTNIHMQSVNGVITKTQAIVGDLVKPGDILCEYTTPQGEQTVLTSDHHGVITSIHNQNIYEISSLDQVQMNIQVTERQITSVEKGQTALIYIDALEKEMMGEVSRIGLVGRAAGDYSVYDVTVALEEESKDLFLGMTGSARIQIETKTDVIKIPMNALIEMDGKKYVLSSEWQNHMNRPQSDYYIEIDTGLSDAFEVEVLNQNLYGQEILIITTRTPLIRGFF